MSKIFSLSDDQTISCRSLRRALGNTPSLKMYIRCKQSPASDSLFQTLMKPLHSTCHSSDLYEEKIEPYIHSEQEKQHYLSCGLKEWHYFNVCGLIRHIDWLSDNGDNIRRVLKGKSPIDKETGQVIELHHIGQCANSPFAELTVSEHRYGKSYSLLHNRLGNEHIARAEFNFQKKIYWMLRLFYDLNS